MILSTEIEKLFNYNDYNACIMYVHAYTHIYTQRHTNSHISHNGVSSSDRPHM